MHSHIQISEETGLEMEEAGKEMENCKETLFCEDSPHKILHWAILCDSCLWCASACLGHKHSSSGFSQIGKK